MASELIGSARCPFCRSDKAKLTLAKSGYPVLTCNRCNMQAFARSELSDEGFRSTLVTPVPVPPAEHEKQPIAQAVDGLALQARKGMGWGVLG